MSGQDLMLELRDNQRLQERSLGEFGRRGRAYAEAEMKYRIAFAKKILLLKNEGYPATLIGDLCRGDKEIARLRFERDVAEVDLKANQEAIQVYKLKARSLEAQIDREYRG